MEKQSYLHQELDRLFREWSARTALLGAGIFLALIPLDFFSVPEHAVRYLALRVLAAAALVGCSFLVRRARRRAAMQFWVLLAVLLSAAVIETMILSFGGHRSPYLIGMLLLSLTVLGLIPADAGFASLLAGTIFAVYLLPILLWEEVEHDHFFVVSSLLFACCLASGVVIRWYSTRGQLQEILLRHKLVKSRERLESEVVRRAENENRLSLFAAAVDCADEGILIVDLDGRVTYCNTSAAEQTGRLPAEIVGRNIRDVHPEPAALESTILPAMRLQGRWAGEVSGRGRDGTPLALWLSASLVRDDGGRPIAMVGITRDLAEQRKLETERIRAQKLESVGVLAGGLAHDFNNLLTIILGNIDLARLLAGENPDAAEALNHATEAAMRAGDLTRQLITFSRGGQPVKRIGNLADLLRETVVFVAAGSNVACEFDLADNLPAVEFDEGQMRQVVHNLVQNAREAMPEGGKLRVACRPVDLEAGEVSSLPAGRYLRLEFADEGKGIAAEHLSRIFDPYFSTKNMDTVKGRGLGLAVTYSIIRNHGGAIRADSLPGAGTRIVIYLPESKRAAEPQVEEERKVADEAPEDEGVAETSMRPEGPVRGRVLVMDDEPLVLGMAGAALRRLGYAATLCRSGAEAVVQYQIGLDTGRRFDAAILDLTVPGGLGGPETLKRL
jgi:PAS domain S-box-containing protein